MVVVYSSHKRISVLVHMVAYFVILIRRVIMNQNVIRFLLTFFLGFIGCIIINHTSLKPEGFKARTLAYLILGIVTFNIYPLVASICNFKFDANKESNIGYVKA